MIIKYADHMIHVTLGIPANVVNLVQENAFFIKRDAKRLQAQ